MSAYPAYCNAVTSCTSISSSLTGAGRSSRTDAAPVSPAVTPAVGGPAADLFGEDSSLPSDKGHMRGTSVQRHSKDDRGSNIEHLGYEQPLEAPAAYTQAAPPNQYNRNYQYKYGRNYQYNPGRSYHFPSRWVYRNQFPGSYPQHTHLVAGMGFSPPPPPATNPPGEDPSARGPSPVYIWSLPPAHYGWQVPGQNRWNPPPQRGWKRQMWRPGAFPRPNAAAGPPPPAPRYHPDFARSSQGPIVNGLMTSDELDQRIASSGIPLNPAPPLVVAQHLATFLSRRNVVEDSSIVALIDSEDGTIPVAAVASHTAFRRLGVEPADILAAAETHVSSRVLEVDRERQRVKPVMKGERATVILRDVPADVSTWRVRELVLSTPGLQEQAEQEALLRASGKAIPLCHPHPWRKDIPAWQKLLSLNPAANHAVLLDFVDTETAANCVVHLRGLKDAHLGPDTHVCMKHSATYAPVSGVGKGEGTSPEPVFIPSPGHSSLTAAIVRGQRLRQFPPCLRPPTPAVDAGQATGAPARVSIEAQSVSQPVVGQQRSGRASNGGSRQSNMVSAPLYEFMVAEEDGVFTCRPHWRIPRVMVMTDSQRQFMPSQYQNRKPMMHRDGDEREFRQSSPPRNYRGNSYYPRDNAGRPRRGGYVGNFSYQRGEESRREEWNTATQKGDPKRRPFVHRPRRPTGDGSPAASSQQQAPPSQAPRRVSQSKEPSSAPPPQAAPYAMNDDGDFPPLEVAAQETGSRRTSIGGIEKKGSGDSLSSAKKGVATNGALSSRRKSLEGSCVVVDNRTRLWPQGGSGANDPTESISDAVSGIDGSVSTTNPQNNPLRRSCKSDPEANNRSSREPRESTAASYVSMVLSNVGA